MRHYVDASALVKLTFREPESAALRALLGHRPELVSSDLVRVELPRAVRRRAASHDLDLQRLLAAVEKTIARVDLVFVTADVLDAAGAIEAPALRSLDAVHLASALSIAPDLASFVTYDGRQAEVARAVGLDVASPR
ncbi:MAG: type II toxin-antitoxin system VapC family toxin [Thermoleophilaceae bacterium]